MLAKDILGEMVAINSVFPNEGKLGAYLCKYLRSQGFEVRKQPMGNNRFNIFASRGKGSKALMFYGHMDTVPAYGNWTTDPFVLTKRGDRLYGVGACDMKGGISSVLEAIRHIDRNKRIKLLFCVDEENISKGIWTAVKEEDWFEDVYFVLSVEPGDSKRQTGGANIVTVGRRGRVVISVDVSGVSSHGANPQRGINALDEAARIVLALKQFDIKRQKGFGSESVFTNAVEGRATSLSVPDKAHIDIDVQLVPPYKIESARRRVEELINGLYANNRLNRKTKVKVYIKKRETPYINPYVNDLNASLIRNVLKVVKRSCGSAKINYGSSVADDNVISDVLQIPVVTIGPRGGSIHGKNEWVSEKSIAQIVRLYVNLANELS